MFNEITLCIFNWNSHHQVISPEEIDFWHLYEKRILFLHPTLVAFTSQEDHSNSSFHTSFLPNEMSNLGYSLIAYFSSPICYLNCLGKQSKLQTSIYIRHGMEEFVSSPKSTKSIHDRFHMKTLKHYGSLNVSFDISSNDIHLSLLISNLLLPQDENQLRIFDSLVSSSLDLPFNSSIDFAFFSGSFNSLRSKEGEDLFYFHRKKWNLEEGVNDEGCTFEETCKLSPKRKGNKEQFLRPYGRNKEEYLFVDSSHYKNPKKKLWCDRILHSSYLVECIDYVRIDDPDTRMIDFDHAMVSGFYSLQIPETTRGRTFARSRIDRY